MSSRIRIFEDESFDVGLDDDDRIRPAGTGITRRNFHDDSQRAPLLRHSQRTSRTSHLSFPAPPPPTYQSQPHQLIAICLNHMSGRPCEHCHQLNREFPGVTGNVGNLREDGSPDSANTLATELEHERKPQHKQRQASSGSKIDDYGKPADGGEKGEDKSPPTPVGFADKRLSKVRLEVLGLWARTSTLSSRVARCTHSIN